MTNKTNKQESGKYLIKKLTQGCLGYYTDVFHVEDILGSSDGPSVRARTLDNHYILEASYTFAGLTFPFGIEDLSVEERKIRKRLLKKLEKLCLDKNNIHSVFKPANPQYEIIYDFDKSELGEENGQ